MTKITCLKPAILALMLALYAVSCDTGDTKDADRGNAGVEEHLDHDHEAVHSDGDVEHAQDHDISADDHDGDAEEHDRDYDADGADHDADSDQDYDHAADDGDHESDALGDDHDAVHSDADEEHLHEEDASGRVEAGEEWERLIGLKTAAAGVRTIEVSLSVPGRIVPDPNRVAVVSPLIESSVNRVFANVGDRIARGDVLACLISPQIGMLRAEYDRAKAELSIMERNFTRRKRLFDEKIIPEKTLQEAELELQVAEVNHRYAVRKLLALGVGGDEIDNPPTGHSEAVGSTMHITAPLPGVVTARNALVGEKVDGSTRLFEIMDLDTVWLEADVFEKDMTKIETGRPVSLRVSAYPGEVFNGDVFFIGSALDNATKTVRIMAEIDNASGKLKPGMFADTGIEIGRRGNALVVPKEAVLEDEDLKIVFVREGSEYHRHVVSTGIESGPYIEILSGLHEGDVVVTIGAYQLKSRLRMTGVDPHAGHNH